jgi:Family of unknown function (DUF6498)
MDQTRKSRPERIRVRLRDDDGEGATPLELPARRMWPVSLILGVMFAMFAAVWWSVLTRMTSHSVRGVFDLMFVLFEGFWLLGWSVGVAILGSLTVLFLFYGESARLQQGRLVHVLRLGPLKIIFDYDLARVRNVRLEKAGGEGNVRIRFDYRDGSDGIGDVMPRSDAQRLVDSIQSASAAAGSMPDPAPAPEARGEPAPAPVRALDQPAPPPLDRPAASPAYPSSLALIIANLIPLAGVLFFGWDLAAVMILFWAESAVIAFYTMLKMAIVGKLAAIVAVPFFLGHFGGFMAGHFLFIYSFFVRGIEAAGPEPGAREALLGVFIPIWPSLAALFISHGVSFFTNFVGRREYASATVKGLMAAPYNRIVVMHIAIIFGGWIVMLLKNPVPALALFVLLKTAMDLTAHRKEHQGRSSPDD